MSVSQENSILSALTQQELDFLSPNMKLLKVKQGDVLFEPGQMPEYYYFPITCSLELSIDLADGGGASTAVIDSIFPIDLSVDGLVDYRATVHRSGQCYRIPAWVFHEALRQSNRLLWRLLKEAVKISRMTALDSVCLRRHSLEQITAKLILMSLDESNSTVSDITHQDMANSLGTRRESVTLAIGKLKDRHLISTGRGRIKLLDRTGLEQAACECYRSMKQIKILSDKNKLIG